MNDTTYKILIIAFLWFHSSTLLAYLMKDEILLKQRKLGVTIETVDKASANELPFNQVFSVNISFDVRPSNDDIEIVSFDMTMPEHNHGMVLKPKIVRLGSNKFRIDGIKLHMKGLWRLQMQGSISREKFDWQKDLNL